MTLPCWLHVPPLVELAISATCGRRELNCLLMKLSSVAMEVQPRVQLMTVSAPDRGLRNRLTWLVTCIGLTVRAVVVLVARLTLVVRVTVSVVVVPVQPKLLLNVRWNLLRLVLLVVTWQVSRLVPVGSVAILVVLDLVGSRLLSSLNAAIGMLVLVVLRCSRLVRLSVVLSISVWSPCMTRCP